MAGSIRRCAIPVLQKIYTPTVVSNSTQRKLSSATALQDVVIVSAVRTPIGSYNGRLAPMTATDLGATVIKEAVERAGVAPESIEDCYMGFCIGAGAGQVPARQALLKAGLPDSVESTTINKACASGMKAVMIAAQTIMLGQQNVVIAGGMESMSNCPYLLHRKYVDWKADLHDSLFHDGFLDPLLNVLMGNCAETTNRKYNITREELDEYSIRSYARSTHAWQHDVYNNEVMPTTVQTKDKASGPTISYAVDEDEEYRHFKPEKIPQLKPAFEKDGSLTAASSSKMSDGACALILMSAEAADKFGAKPMARIVGFADAATEPMDFTGASVMATRKLLERAGVSKDDIDMWEISEAFSTVPIVNIKELDLKISKVNKHGGAISLGHPVGASGARLTGHLAHNLKKGQLGAANICNGGGAASAILVEGL